MVPGKYTATAEVRLTVFVADTQRIEAREVGWTLDGGRVRFPEGGGGVRTCILFIYRKWQLRAHITDH